LVRSWYYLLSKETRWKYLLVIFRFIIIFNFFKSIQRINLLYEFIIFRLILILN
jgi:hypothetical protein